MIPFLCAWASLARQGDEARFQRVEAEVLILESRARPLQAETDKGPARMVAVTTGIFIIDLPRGATSGEIQFQEGISRKFEVDSVPWLAYDKPLGKVTTRATSGSLQVDNTAGTTQIVLIAITDSEDPERRRIVPTVVPPGEKRTVDHSSDVRAYVVDPVGRCGVRCEPPSSQQSEPGLRFNSGPVGFRGLTPHVKGVFGFDLVFHLAERSYDSLPGQSKQEMPLVQSIQVNLAFEKKSFEAIGLGLSADFDLFEIEVEGFLGNWRGQARMTASNQPQNGASDTDIDGTLLGWKLTLHWPMLVYRSDLWDLSVGPDLEFLVFEEKLKEVKNAPFAIEDTLRENVFSAGPRLGASVPIGSGRLSMEGSLMFLFGDLQGVGAEVNLGYTFSF